MKSTQLKDRAGPVRRDFSSPIFSWAKTADFEDDFYTWWLFYGDSDGKGTLCMKLYYPRSQPLGQRQRLALSRQLRFTKHQLRRKWRERYPEA